MTTDDLRAKFEAHFPRLDLSKDGYGNYYNAKTLMHFYGWQAAHASRDAEVEALRRQVGDLAALVRRLAHSLDKPNGNTLLARQASDYLRRHAFARHADAGGIEMTCNECEHGQLRRSCEICELRAEAEEQSRLIEKQAAEIARLCQRIESAPVYYIPTDRPTSEDGWLNVIDSVKALDALRGKRVRLVVEDVE